MPNPFLTRFGNNQMASNPMSNLMGMMSQFNNFARNFRGNPRQQVEQLLTSGQMSKEQFEQLSQVALQFQQMMSNK